jgi:hypothetical protein
MSGKDVLHDFIAHRKEIQAAQIAKEEITPLRQEWLPSIERRLMPATAPEIRELQPAQLDAIREQQFNAMQQYLMTTAPEHMLLLRFPAGSGKTWSGARAAHWYYQTTGRRVLYAGPRKDFFVDVMQASAGQNIPLDNWYKWLPQQKDNGDGSIVTTCRYADYMQAWLQHGYPGRQFCFRVCGDDYIKDGCPYHAQRKQPQPLIYGHHNHVLYGHLLAEEFGAVIGDESPLNQIVHEWRVPSRFLVHNKLPLDHSITEIIFTLEKIAQEKKIVSGDKLIQLLGGPDLIIEACKEIAGHNLLSDRNPPPPHIGYSVAKVREEIQFNYLPTFIPLLQREAEAYKTGLEYPERLFVGSEHLTMLARRSVDPKMPKHIIWFDATGRSDIYSAMFERPVKVVEMDASLRGFTIQVVDHVNSRSALFEYKQEEVTDEEGDQITVINKVLRAERADRLAQQIQTISHKYNNPTIITFQAIKEWMEKEEKLPQHANATYFYANRGTNAFQTTDAVIIAGTPMPPPHDIHRIAKCLWFDSMEPFADKWITVQRTYNYRDESGQGWSYAIGEFWDERLNTVLWQLREAEIIQSANRARILYRDVPVYLLTNLPIDELPPRQLLSIRELLDAPEGVNMYIWARISDVAERISNEKGFVTINDIMQATGANRKTTKRHVDLLLATGQWEQAIVRNRTHDTALIRIQTQENEEPAG